MHFLRHADAALYLALNVLGKLLAAGVVIFLAQRVDVEAEQILAAAGNNHFFNAVLCGLETGSSQKAVQQRSFMLAGVRDQLLFGDLGGIGSRVYSSFDAHIFVLHDGFVRSCE